MLKTVKPHDGDTGRNLRLLEREYDLLRRLDSPFIVSVWQLADVPSLGRCILMEYADGRTLDEFIREKPSEKQRRQVLDELLQAVDYLHKKQIVHADLKPQNILVTHNGNHLKLLDLGLSDDDTWRLRRIGSTRAFAAPEQLQEDGHTDARTDIYALGLLIRLLFPHRHPLVTRRCLHTSPDKRYSSVAELRADLMSHRVLWLVVLCLLMFLLIFLAGRRLFHSASVSPAVPPEVSQPSDSAVAHGGSGKSYLLGSPYSSSPESGKLGFDGYVSSVSSYYADSIRKAREKETAAKASEPVVLPELTLGYLDARYRAFYDMYADSVRSLSSPTRETASRYYGAFSDFISDNLRKLREEYTASYYHISDDEIRRSSLSRMEDLLGSYRHEPANHLTDSFRTNIIDPLPWLADGIYEAVFNEWTDSLHRITLPYADFAEACFNAFHHDMQAECRNLQRQYPVYSWWTERHAQERESELRNRLSETLLVGAEPYYRLPHLCEAYNDRLITKTEYIDFMSRLGYSIDTENFPDTIPCY